MELTMKKILSIALLSAVAMNSHAFTIIDWGNPPPPVNPPIKVIPAPKAIAKPIVKITYTAFQHRIATTKFDDKLAGVEAINPCKGAACPVQPKAIKVWTDDFKLRYGLDKQKTCKYTKEYLKAWLDKKEGVVDSPNWDHCDLSGIDLSLKLVNNPSINYTKIDSAKVGVFRNSHGFGATFFKTDMDGADMSGAKLRMVLVQSANVDGSKWNRSDIRGYWISDSSGKMIIGSMTFMNGFVDKSVLIDRECRANPPKLALCPGSDARLATIAGLIVTDSNVTNLNLLSAKLKDVLFNKSDVSGLAPSDAVQAKNIRVRDSYRTIIIYKNGKPFELKQVQMGWGGDAYWNF